MAKSGVFKFYLLGSIDPGVRYDAGAILKGLFDQGCDHPNNTRFSHSDWYTNKVCSAATVQEHDLIIYYRPSRVNSIIAGKGVPLTYSEKHSGSKVKLTTGVCSEIYKNKVQGDPLLPRLLAYLTFHEWMHNKLDADTSNPLVVYVHSDGGGGLASAELSATKSAISPKNRQLMAGVLGKKVKQHLHTLLLGDN
jgi:hypothetical protein